MIRQLTTLFLNLIQSYFFIIVVALGAALILPSKVALLAPLATFFLQIIFFLTSLKLDVKKVLKDVKDIKMIAAAVIFTLLIFPAIVFISANIAYPRLAVGLLLLAAMPSGMTAPLLTEVVGGKTGMALVITIITSLLAPFSIPFVISIFAKTAVTVSAITMIWSLIKVIIIPFILAQIVRRLWHGKIKSTFFTFKPISLILLGLLIAGLVARQASIILSGAGESVVMILITLYVFIAALFFIGYFVAFWRPCEDRVTISVSLAILNFTLAIYIAGEFFTDPNVLLATVLVIFPWATLLLPYKFIVRRYVCPVKK